MNKKFLILLSACVLLFSAMGVKEAHAVSPYDDAYQTTNTLRLTGTWYGIDEDVSEDWVQFILQDKPYANLNDTLFRTDNNMMTEQEKQDMRDSWGNAHNWTVSNYCWESGSELFCDIYINWSESPLSLTWNEENVVVDDVEYSVKVSQNTGSLGDTRTDVQVRDNLSQVNVISRINNDVILNFLAFVDNPNYPVDYEGEELRESHTPPQYETLYPEYSWSVTKDENGNGILRVQYMGNISPFLTGTSFLVVDKMTEKWGGLDGEIASLNYQPAGWADWSVNLGDEPLYFMYRVDHNQQLDNPPWTDDIEYTIGQVYYQVYWDGQKAYLAGTTIGCDGSVCNQFETEEEPINSVLGNLSGILDISIDTGLTNIVTAPIEFIKSLPSNTCTPINAPLPYTGGTLTLPCLKPMYDQYVAPVVLMWQVALTALVSYAVATKVFAKLRETYNPRSNSIEVTNL